MAKPINSTIIRNSSYVTIVDGKPAFVSEIPAMGEWDEEAAHQAYLAKRQAMYEILPALIDQRLNHCEDELAAARNRGLSIAVIGHPEAPMLCWNGGHFSFHTYNTMRDFVANFDPRDIEFYDDNADYSDYSEQQVRNLLDREEFRLMLQQAIKMLIPQFPNIECPAEFGTWDKLQIFMLDELITL